MPAKHADLIRLRGTFPQRSVNVVEVRVPVAGIVISKVKPKSIS